jgi:hypothetical protein
MSRIWKNGIGPTAIALVVGAILLLNSGPSAAQRETRMPAHYSVVATDGSHLIVVDNATNKLYFYAIDREGKVGDELKLRGTVDLNDAGKPVIKPVDARPLR